MGRFDTIIEIYDIRNQKRVKKIETYFKEGVKTILIFQAEYHSSKDFVLVAGPYSDEEFIL